MPGSKACLLRGRHISSGHRHNLEIAGEKRFDRGENSRPKEINRASRSAVAAVREGLSNDISESSLGTIAAERGGFHFPKKVGELGGEEST